MATSARLRRAHAPALLLTLAAGLAAADDRDAAAPAASASAAAAAGASQTVTITGATARLTGIAGFGNVAAEATPIALESIGHERLDDAGVSSLRGLSRFDASVGDAYNADGYWAMFAIRGFVLDNRRNYLRDGLPINAETALALDNKERIDVLKGTSGIQAGTSAPGGLVDLVVKRPAGRLRNVRFGYAEDATFGSAVDLGDVSADGRFGWRLNVAAEHLDPPTRHTSGKRALAALALDWNPTAATLLQAEVETSRQRQPSVVGFSMLGDRVPSPKEFDPRTNLNDQPWADPVVLQGTTASLRWQQTLAPAWRFSAHAMVQRLHSDDRTAFPFGVFGADYTCAQWCDRFAPDGSFTYWQFESDGERRSTDALDLRLAGRVATGAVEHALEFGVLRTQFRARFGEQIYDIAGTGNVDDTVVVPPSPGYTSPNTDRDEKSTEWYLRDAMRLPAGFGLWLGVRHSELDRRSVQTSPDAGGLHPTRLHQNVSIPWAALTHALDDATLVYASWGRGLETAVAPSQPFYTNAGEPLPALKSRQVELGIKRRGSRYRAGLALFDIERPQPETLANADGSATYAVDGSARHRGVEAQFGWDAGAWRGDASLLLLDAERQGASDPTLDGTRPVNVPRRSLRVGAGYRVPQTVVGSRVELRADLAAESDRTVLPGDDRTRIGGWARLDLGARAEQRLGASTLTWRIGVDNVLDRRAWKESPYQFGHVYLYPLEPRRWRASLELAF